MSVTLSPCPVAPLITVGGLVARFQYSVRFNGTLLIRPPGDVSNGSEVHDLQDHDGVRVVGQDAPGMGERPIRRRPVVFNVYPAAAERALKVRAVGSHLHGVAHIGLPLISPELLSA